MKSGHKMFGKVKVSMGCSKKIWRGGGIAGLDWERYPYPSIGKEVSPILQYWTALGRVIKK